MKKNIKITISLLLAALLLCLSFAACSKSGASSLLGKWEFTDDETSLTGSIEFKKDDVVTMSISGVSVDGTYKVNGDKVTIKMSVMGQETEETETFKVSGNKLTMTDSNGTVTEYTKK